MTRRLHRGLALSLTLPIALAACAGDAPQTPDAGGAAPAIVEVARPADADRCTVTAVDCEQATFSCNDIPSGSVFSLPAYYFDAPIHVGVSTGGSSLTFQRPIDHSLLYSTLMCSNPPGDPSLNDAGADSACQIEYDRVTLPAECPDSACTDRTLCVAGYTEYCISLPTTHTAFPIKDFKTFSMPLQVNEDGVAFKTYVNVSIIHPWSGDLVIKLIAPDQTVYVLWNRQGGGTPFGNKTFEVNTRGEARKGLWWLQVSDNAARDEGTCTDWSMTIEPYGGA